MIKVVLIDIDNTILSFDGYVRESLRSGFEKFRLGEYQDYVYDTFTRINLGLWDGIEKGTLTFEELENIRFRKVFDALGIEFDGSVFEKYFRECLDVSAIPIAGAAQMLMYLSEKYILATASNGPYEQQISRLEIGNMLSYFTYHFVSGDIGFQKPSREFFDCVMKRLREDMEISPDECVIIGDSLSSDMAGGEMAGMKTIFFNPAGKKIPEDRKIDFVITSLNQIQGIL